MSLSLAKDPATLPFFQAYQTGIVAEDGEVLISLKEDSEDSGSEGDEHEDSRTYIGSSEIRERVRNKEVRMTQKYAMTHKPFMLSWGLHSTFTILNSLRTPVTSLGLSRRETHRCMMTMTKV